MALEAQIMEDLKTAMKAKDRIALEALRAIKTAILNEKTAAGATEITEAGELKLLTKLRKQRVESATIFRDQGRKIWQPQKRRRLKSLNATYPLC